MGESRSREISEKAIIGDQARSVCSYDDSISHSDTSSTNNHKNNINICISNMTVILI